MKARALSYTIFLSLGLAALPKDVLADEAEPNPMGGFGATIIYENAVGRGTFTTGGEFNDRSLWTMLLSVRPKWTFHDEENLKFTLGARLDVDKNIVENADSLNTRKHETNVYDVRLSLAWGGYEIKPAKLTVSSVFEIFTPTSKLSQLQNKILGTRLYVTTSYKPLSWLSATWQVYATKNFNKYTNNVLDSDDFDIAPLTRAGGAEAVAEGLAAIGSGNPEWGLTNRGILEFSFLEKFSFTIDFLYTQSWTYNDIEIDALSSPNAVAGRGYTDLATGTLEVAYDVTDYLNVALGTTTEQTPKTADNKEFRFPFWDTSNGADNRQIFYLDLTGKF